MMPRYSWPDGKRLAVSFVVNVEEGAELRITDGDRSPEPVDELGIVLKGPHRNYGNESNYAYGVGPAARRVIKLLGDTGIKATFTAAGLALERAPHIARAIADGGHEACAHGWRWVPQHRLDEASERDFIRKASGGLAVALPPYRQHAASPGRGRLPLSHGRLQRRHTVLGHDQRQADCRSPLLPRYERHEDVERAGTHADRLGHLCH
jgi:hypothetical protein